MSKEISQGLDGIYNRKGGRNAPPKTPKPNIKPPPQKPFLSEGEMEYKSIMFEGGEVSVYFPQKKRGVKISCRSCYRLFNWNDLWGIKFLSENEKRCFDYCLTCMERIMLKHNQGDWFKAYTLEVGLQKDG